MALIPLAFSSLWQTGLLLTAGFVAVGWISLLRSRIRALDEMNRGHEKEREAVLEFLHRMGEMVTRETDLETTLDIITDFIIEETGASAGAIYLTEEVEGRRLLRARVVRGLFPPLHGATGYVLTRRKYLHDKIRAEKIPVGEGVVGHVAQTGEGLLLRDARADSRIPPEAHELVPLESMMLMPLLIRDRLVGVFAVVNKRTQGQTFTEDDMGLLQTLSDQAAVTVNIVQLYDELTEKHRIESELQIAKDFQRLLLPGELPEIAGFEIATHCSPALEMGGDFFDFIRVDDNHLGIVIADVSGKGIPGALIMATCRSALRAEARGRLSPAEVLRVLNQRIYEDTRDNVFITMTYAILNLRSRHLRFARAGHEPTIACTAGDRHPVLYTPDGIALGLVGGEMFDVIEEKLIDLSETDLIVLYTDGVIEAMNEDSEEYGQERFLNLLQRSPATGADPLIERLLADIQDFTHGIPQHDDITLVALRRVTQAAESEDPVRQTQTG
jgi:sigma-B regulation protein RsbU (phosphoserine phosphatase)